MKTKQLLSHSDLRQFTGDLKRYRTISPLVIYTPGVRYLAEIGKAYWLIDAITSYYGTNAMRRAIKTDYRLETLQFWRLEVASDQSAILSSRADSDVPPFVAQIIPYTDFPLSYVDIWSGFDGHYWTLYLPSEH